METLEGASGDERMSVQIQSILYNVEPVTVTRTLEAIARASELAISAGLASTISVSFGDTSTLPCLSAKDLTDFTGRYRELSSIDYKFFEQNLGSAEGHNRLAKSASADLLLFLNPDVIMSPRLICNLIPQFRNPLVGMVEAKQLPIEHPKDFNPMTGETSWATTACALTRRPLFEKLEGFDSSSFFLYCDDLDYSWRVREAGLKVIFAPDAVAFHDKRISSQGAWQPSAAERKYSAEAALMLAHKWSRPEIVERITSIYSRSGADERDALMNYEEKKHNGLLPVPRDPEHKIGYFDGDFYAKHRYLL